MRSDSQKGGSLIAIIGGAAIGSVVVMGIYSAMDAQSRQTAALTQKLAILDVERVVSETLADSSVCSYHLTTPPRTLNPMDVGGVSPPRWTIPTLLAKGVAGAPPVLETNGAPASPLTPTVVANSIAVEDMVCVPQPCTPTTNSFRANLTVTFDAARLIGSRNSLKFPITFRTSGPAGVQIVTSCAPPPAPSGLTMITTLPAIAPPGPILPGPPLIPPPPAPLLYHYSPVASCPAGNRLLFFGLSAHQSAVEMAPDGNIAYHYCRCEQMGEGVRAGVLTTTANPNYYCICNGLCGL